jgi:LmbE family N-acetylglucosaminyl deacetylase
LNKWKTTACFLAFLTTSFLTASAPTFAQAASSKRVQLICDQKTIGQGGAASFHIIYHNVQNKKFSNVFLQIHVPEGLDVDADDLDGGVWNAANRLLIWNLQNVNESEVRLIHFQLSVPPGSRDGTVYTMTCIGDEDGHRIETSGVTLQMGEEIHQPFFFGFPDGNFHPTSYLTRAESAAVITNLLHLQNDPSPERPYTDVPRNHWAARYIDEVTNAGVMRGYDDGSFHPDDPITRAELVTVLLQLRGIEAVPVRGFMDTQHHWARDAIATGKALGFFSGTGNNKFAPDEPVERQAAAVFFDVTQFRGPLVDGDIPVVQHFPDVPRTAWSFGWVEESAKTAHESVGKGRSEFLLRYVGK